MRIETLHNGGKFVHRYNVRTSHAQLVHIKSHVILDTWCKNDRSQYSFGRTFNEALFRGCVSFGSKVGVSLKSTPLLTQMWTCWELATCICVFSRSHSPLLTDLSVRYLLKSYIFNSVCLNMTSRCRYGEAWKTSLSKTTFVSPKKYARGSSIAGNAAYSSKSENVNN